jgi:hypothetical protein
LGFPSLDREEEEEEEEEEGLIPRLALSCARMEEEEEEEDSRGLYFLEIV